MENKNVKMDCWDFVFSFVKSRINSLVEEADKYTKRMNEDYGNFFCCYAEDMYKVQRELVCYRALNKVLAVRSHEEVKNYIDKCICGFTDSLLSGKIRQKSTSSVSDLAYTLELEVKQDVREKFIFLLDSIERGEKVTG